MNELDALVKDYYRGRRLSSQLAEVTLALASGKRTPERVWHLRIAALAAVLVAGFLAVHFHLAAQSTTERVLGEIAMNHQKQLAVEVATESYADLRAAMDRLDFDIEPARVVSAAYDLVGGRYCSIQGSLAAQIKIRERGTGRMLTLYAAELTPERANIERQERVHDGVRIKLWSEGDVFFGLADQS